MTAGFGLAEPSGGTRAADVLALAEVVLQAFPRGDDLLYRAAADVGRVESADLQLIIGSSTLRLGLAALSAVQLALDAASVVAEFVEDPRYVDGEIDSDYLRELASGPPTFELQIAELSTGSIISRLKVVRRKESRAKLLSALLIASLILTPFTGVIPSMVVTGLIAANEFIPTKTVEQVQQQVDAVNRALADKDRTINALQERVERLESVVAQQVQAAGVSVRVEITVISPA